MADKDAAAKETLARNKEASEKSRADYEERMKGKPTPTQEENDLAMLGVHVTEHEEDGSPPDQFNQAVVSDRSVEAKKPAGGYQTRQATPAPKHASSRE